MDYSQIVHRPASEADGPPVKMRSPTRKRHRLALSSSLAADAAVVAAGDMAAEAVIQAAAAAATPAEAAAAAEQAAEVVKDAAAEAVGAQEAPSASSAEGSGAVKADDAKVAPWLLITRVLFCDIPEYTAAVLPKQLCASISCNHAFHVSARL